MAALSSLQAIHMSNPLLPVSTSIEIDIPFQDIDAMEVVWHGNYTRYLEIARCALLDCIDYDYPRMRDSGFAWPVIDLRIKFIRPLQFKQRIRVQAELKEYENRLKMEFIITDAYSSQKLSKAYTTQVAVNMQTQEMCFISPPVLLEKLAAYQQKKQALNNTNSDGVLS
jgi:acyl-CoA thioester hydrolase